MCGHRHHGDKAFVTFWPFVAFMEKEEAAQERHQQHRQLHHDQQLQQQQLQQQRQHELRREIGRPPAADITPSVPSTITASTAINGDKSSSSTTTTLMSSASPGRGGAPRPLPTPQDISIPPISAPFSRLSTTRPSPSPTGRRVMHADGTMSGGGGGGGAGGGGVGSGGGQRRNVTPPRNHLSMNLAPEDDSEAAERDMLHSETDMEGELLGQLQELHRQLAELRQQSNREERERQLFDTSSKLIVCATTKPVRLVKAKEGDAQWIYEEYKGRFRSAIDSLAGTNRVRWVSWPGTTVDLGSQESVRRRLDSEFACTPVFLSHEVANAYYHKFCHGVLWPLFHCINTNFFNEGLLESFMEQYDAYVHANQCYLEVVADTYEPGDLVLVLDYELMLLPMLLRKRFPDVVCGFFLHCPFPSSEFYRMLPVRQTLLQAHIGAMFMVAYMIIFSAITSLELFIQERSLFVHEKTSGFYRTSAYFIAKVFCEILPTRLVPTIFYAVITAYMAGLRTDFYHLSMYWLTLTVTSITSTSLCLLVSCATSVYSAAFLGCGAFYLLFMLASGFVLQADKIPVYLAPFKWLSFYRYCLQNLLALDLEGRVFNCFTPEEIAASGQVSICLPTGDLYLSSQGIDPQNVWRNIGILTAMIPCYLGMAYLFLRSLKKKS
ncbi:hypothetical protein VYU27_007416 [Nannochloropsis oceanica]